MTNLMYFLIGLSFCGVALIMYYFVSVFVKRKVFRILFTALMISICVFAYILNHRKPSVVIMREDVLYVAPNKN